MLLPFSLAGVYLGGGLASLSILLDEQLGWRTTLGVVGLCGILVSLTSFLLIDEPKDRVTFQDYFQTLSADRHINDKSKGEDNTMIASVQRTFSELGVGFQEIVKSTDANLLFAAAAVRFCAGFSIGQSAHFDQSENQSDLNFDSLAHFPLPLPLCLSLYLLPSFALSLALFPT